MFDRREWLRGVHASDLERPGEVVIHRNAPVTGIGTAGNQNRAGQS
jgi:hypothetical protein